MTITVPKLPTPTPPAGFVLDGYEVMYDGSSEEMADGKTIREAVERLEVEFVGCFRVYADCKEEGGVGEMTCEWDFRKQAWHEWEWK